MRTERSAEETVSQFLSRHDRAYASAQVSFLAAGEYNENYRVQLDEQDLVFRINHGTQLGLQNQIEYEYRVLQSVAPSGVTPTPIELFEASPEFPRGSLLMEYLPGRPLDYQSDLEGAASCFAAIHELPPADDLIVQAQPVRDILNECEELLGRYTAHPRKELTPLLATYKRKIERLADSPATAFADDRLCVVNTEVNSGNFVVDDAVRLVDWEKAVISYRYQDLGHFLVPTTTLWKTDYEFTEVDRRRFLTLYHDAAHPAVSLDHLDEYTAVLEKTILLRAFSWCYMATAEYAMGDRSLQNADTLETMDFYLSNAERFLDLS